MALELLCSCGNLDDLWNEWCCVIPVGMMAIFDMYHISIPQHLRPARAVQTIYGASLKEDLQVEDVLWECMSQSGEQGLC